MSIELNPTLYYRVTEFDERKTELEQKIQDGIFGADQELARLLDEESKEVEEHGSDGELVIASSEELSLLAEESRRFKGVGVLLNKSASNCFKRFSDFITTFPGEPPTDKLILQTIGGTIVTVDREIKLHPFVGKPRVETFGINYDVDKWSVSVILGVHVPKDKTKEERIIAYVDLIHDNKPVKKKLPLRSMLAASLVNALDTATPYHPQGQN